MSKINWSTDSPHKISDAHLDWNCSCIRGYLGWVSPQWLVVDADKFAWQLSPMLVQFSSRISKSKECINILQLALKATWFHTLGNAVVCLQYYSEYFLATYGWHINPTASGLRQITFNWIWIYQVLSSFCMSREIAVLSHLGSRGIACSLQAGYPVSFEDWGFRARCKIVPRYLLEIEKHAFLLFGACFHPILD